MKKNKLKKKILRMRRKHAQFLTAINVLLNRGMSDLDLAGNQNLPLPQVLVRVEQASTSIVGARTLVSDKLEKLKRKAANLVLTVQIEKKEKKEKKVRKERIRKNKKENKTGERAELIKKASGIKKPKKVKREKAPTINKDNSIGETTTPTVSS